MDSLQRIITQRTRDTVELNARLNLIFEILRRDIYQAKELSLQTAQLADSLHQDRWLMSAYTYLIIVNREMGLFDSGRYYLNKAERLSKANPENKRMQFNFLKSAGLFYKDIGEYNKALPFVKASLEIWDKQDETRAGQFLNLGNLHYYLGNFKEAAEQHMQGLRLFEKLKNLRGQAFCLHSIGNNFFNMNQLATAKNYYERSLQLKEQLGDKRGVLTTTISLGDVYKDMNSFEKASSYYQAGLTAARNLKLPSEEARVLHQWGLLYKRMEENEKARASFSKSLSISKQIGDSTTFIKTQSEIFNLDLAEQSQKKRETKMLDGLNTLIRIGDRSQEALEYHRLSEFYSHNKNYEKALYYLRKHEALSDSIEGNAVLIQLKDVEEKYNNEKKQQEIELLKKNQEVQSLELQKQRANTTLIAIALLSAIAIGTLLVNRYRVMNRIKRQAELERMRQNIARDLHDDIGSTLSSINIMSKLAMQQPDNSNQLQKISIYSSRMMETMSDMVWSINPVNDSVDQMLVKMKEFAGEILEPKNMVYAFNLDEEVTHIRLDVEKRKSVFLIFKEAINNAAKYSEATKVDIGLNRVNGTLYLRVQDNGKGFNSSTARGNGLKNMAARAQAIKGKWKQVSEPGKGTTISVEVPIT
ncbi:MAG TPA: tetratricopeptide repeat protein [Cyclobacteriaceae bacterium]|jgi:two-component system sensor histidine kinase UhpB|nr:tetratricopeptide repeat protein [Cyclobacteriaceae bacterium]HRE66587.1 tetratricopeptide repeat protein [Cyclobacteriaceae bacterium]HRF31879.1 tetratricopeptide repeat protein [Cyclobacteriaceae bacterium]